MKEHLTVKGEITGIRYRNGEGWAIFSVAGCPLPMAGVLPSMCDVGDVVTCTGIEQTSKYGQQIKCSTVVPEAPDTNTEEGVRRLLQKLPGIGPAKAAAAVENYGADGAWSLALSDPSEIGVPILLVKEAKELAASLVTSFDQQIYLLGIGLTEHQASKIYAKYGKHSKDVISQDPYRLIKDLDGVGFLSADKIAFKAGIKASNEARVNACILYVVDDAILSQGHIWWSGWTLCQVVIDALTESAKKAQAPIMDMPDVEAVRKAIYFLASEGLLTISNGKVFSNKFLKAEESIMKFIGRGRQ